MTKPNVTRIAHGVLYVTDLAASRRFYVDLLGLNVLHETEGALYLRGVEDREWTLKLERAPQAGVKHLAYRVHDEADLDALVALAEAQGLPYRWEEELDRPRLLRMQDPFGVPVAFYARPVTHPWLLQEYHLHRGPGIVRVDHVNVMTPNVKGMVDWYGDELGFRLSEYTEDDQGRMWAAWIQRRGSVHDLALTNGRGPRLHHFAFWMPDAMSIIRTCDILAGARQPESIERGPGRHGISNAFFLYIRDPDGHRIELYTNDYVTVDPDFQPIRWSLNDPRRQTLWGAKTPRSWFEEGSVMEAFGGGWVGERESDLEGLPVHVI
ncbi:3,4-dihydroxyphenylacetate 2,3-dioxygenase [Deinococcus maricopensis]|uniref:3,4-dihydroxyphenylacetate 2,3-dioxygenase n=1 Tax=Deinococcus maricopensis (strain DSM 21211 / LMG 22137 / NRRL B-23946 / LB-34) TaxID=709986 RepID=E8U8Z1_DEIML|nr:3,4-dihydroxyphenylacetate 2,3-dioxygenase [Deinococcus maricopensis]ADV67530.1 3,4-dihydroxyphenylacetate 2,3-dioxygenase [Deinococcus maricopensis DSM 21211]